ncbi:MAG: AAA family ATPase [Saprospiraceae bacterium]
MNIHKQFQGLTLSTDQKSAVDSIESFLQSEDQVFLLKGYAGTGKTTILKGIAKAIGQKGKTCRLMAPTGRAAMIISQKTKIPAYTIHKGIYNMDEIKERKENDSYKMFFGLLNNPDPSDSVYIIDEASMISNVFSDDEFFIFGSGFLLNDLLNYVFSVNRMHKIIFVGDPAQLPPVGMNTSPALDLDYFNTHEYNPKEITLREIMRQDEESGIIKTSLALRESIEADVYNKFEVSYNDSDVFKLERKELITSYGTVAKDAGLRNTIIISHSNKQSLMHNLMVRKLRYGGEGSQDIRKRDRLLLTKNNYNGEVELYNGMMADVVEVGEVSRSETIWFKSTNNVTVELHINWRDIIIEVETLDGSCQVRTTILDDFLLAEEGRIDRNTQIALYVDFKNRLGKNGPKEGTDAFKERLRNDKYFNAIQAKYGYAITVHKSQGGEWTHVIADFNTYMGQHNSSYYRWAYTAITRSSKQLHLIDAKTSNPLSKYVIKGIQKLKSPIKDGYYYPNPDSKELFFLEWQKENLLKLAEENEIIVTYIPKQYRQSIAFVHDSDSCQIDVMYNKAFFKEPTVNSSSSDSFKDTCLELLRLSMTERNIKIKFLDDHRFFLNNYVSEVCIYLDIQINNIIQNEWSDKYFFETGSGCTVIEFFFEKKLLYTYAQPHSMEGGDDAKLQDLIRELRG